MASTPLPRRPLPALLSAELRGPTAEEATALDLATRPSALALARAEIQSLGATNDDPILKILQQVPDARSQEDLERVRQATVDVKFFRELNDPSQHLALCRHMTFEEAEFEQTIIKQGETGYIFYIIYTGGVRVHVHNERSATNGDVTPSDSSAPTVGSCVCVLEDGDSFGEIALLGNGLRAATIIAARKTQLLRVEKAAYDKSLHWLHKVELQERVDFLRRCFVFSGWDDEELSKLAKVVSRKRHAKDQCIIQQGPSTDTMYLIVKGRCRVLKRMELPTHLQVQFEAQLGLGAGLHAAERLPPLPRHAAYSSRHADANCPVSTVLELGELAPMQYFGERALLEGKKPRSGAKGIHSASVVSLTAVELLALSKYDFYHFIDEKTRELMTTYADKFYLDEEKIKRSIHQKLRWDAYKHGVLRDVLTPRARSKL